MWLFYMQRYIFLKQLYIHYATTWSSFQNSFALILKAKTRMRIIWNCDIEKEIEIPWPKDHGIEILVQKATRLRNQDNKTTTWRSQGIFWRTQSKDIEKQTINLQCQDTKIFFRGCRLMTLRFWNWKKLKLRF